MTVLTPEQQAVVDEIRGWGEPTMPSNDARRKHRLMKQAAEIAIALAARVEELTAEAAAATDVIVQLQGLNGPVLAGLAAAQFKVARLRKAAELAEAFLERTGAEMNPQACDVLETLRAALAAPPPAKEPT